MRTSRKRTKLLTKCVIIDTDSEDDNVEEKEEKDATCYMRHYRYVE